MNTAVADAGTVIPAKKIRVAYVVHTFDMGGLERCIAHLSNHLDRCHFHPLVICLNRNGDAARWVSASDVEIIELHKRGGNDLRVVGRLAQALRRHKVDWIHSHNWGTLVESVLARKLAHTPHHLHAEHGMELADIRLGGFHKSLRAIFTRWALLTTSEIVTVADSVRKRLVERLRIPSARIRLLSNGVEVAAVAPTARQNLRQSLGIPDHHQVIGSVGRFAPVKNFGALVDAFYHLNRQTVPSSLVLVGDGPTRAAIMQQAQALGLEKSVHFVGQQSSVGDWLSALDIYVNCSLSEAMSLSILEAMGMGLPMVVTDVGDNARLVGGTSGCGTIVPPDDTPALSAALTELTRSPRRLGEMKTIALRRYQREYTTGTMVGRYAQLYSANRLEPTFSGA